MPITVILCSIAQYEMIANSINVIHKYGKGNLFNSWCLIRTQFYYTTAHFLIKIGRQNCRTGKLKIPISKQVGIFVMFLQPAYKDLFNESCKIKLATKIVFVSSVVGESDLNQDAWVRLLSGNRILLLYSPMIARPNKCT